MDVSTSSSSARPRLVLAHLMVAPEQAYFFLRGQADTMIAAGVDLHVISPGGELLDRLGDNTPIQIHRLPLARRIRPLRDLLTLLQLWHLLRHLRPDILQAHSPKGGLLGMLAAWLAAVPVRVYHIHGLPGLSKGGLKSLLLRLSARISCGLATRVWSVGPSVMAEAVQAGLCPADKIEVVGGGSINGVNVRHFDPTPFSPTDRARLRTENGLAIDALVIGFVGRIVRDKGLTDLLEAVVLLHQENPRVQLLLIGPLEAHDRLPSASHRLLASPFVHLTGARYETVPYYAMMDVFCLPSYREGLPICILEASAMRLPVVATRIAGPIDCVIDGESGLLVPVNNSATLAEALRHLLFDPGLRHQMGDAGRRAMIERYDPEQLWAAYLNRYLDLTRQATGRTQIGAISK